MCMYYVNSYSEKRKLLLIGTIAVSYQKALDIMKWNREHGFVCWLNEA